LRKINNKKSNFPNQTFFINNKNSNKLPENTLVRKYGAGLTLSLDEKKKYIEIKTHIKPKNKRRNNNEKIRKIMFKSLSCMNFFFFPSNFLQLDA
jgi:hypothetical protein